MRDLTEHEQALYERAKNLVNRHVDHRYYSMVMNAIDDLIKTMLESEKNK